MNLKKILGVKQKRKNPTTSRFEKVETEIEKLAAQIGVVNEMIKAESEMINSTKEQLGEIRGVLSAKEKEIRELKITIMKSVELVNAAKPEKLMIEAEKQNIKVETLKSKLDVQKGISDKMMSELKSLRRDLKVFRGLKQVIKMSEEARSDLDIVKHIKATIERDTDKAANMLIKFQELHHDFSQYKKSADAIQDQFRQLLKEFDELRISLGKPAEKEGILKRFMKLRF